jgi:hypothetical protein
MGEFQQFWGQSGDVRGCPLPVLTGARQERVVPVEQVAGAALDEWKGTSAQTPINKVDDYEFSRIFGYEKDGHMVEPRENYNRLLDSRQFDWVEKPLTAESRSEKYRGLTEGFTAAGDLVSEAVARYGEKGGVQEDVECKLSREAKEVSKMVARAYESDPDWEPVLTRVGPHHWEVAELKPRRREGVVEDDSRAPERILDEDRPQHVRVDYKFQGTPDKGAIDPFFIAPGNLPFETERQKRDPFYGPVPGLERPFAPTFDHASWV